MAQSPDEAESRALSEGAREFGLELPTHSVVLLLRFLDLVYDWNRSAGLTAVARVDAVRLHLLDSLSLSPFFGDDDRIADLGSGAGFPGIPLAVSLPKTRITLVESRRRKCSFLVEAVRALGLKNVSIAHRDARTLTASDLRVDAVVARAFLPPANLLELAARLVTPGGRVLVMGSRRTVDLDAVGSDRRDFLRTGDVVFTLPGGIEQRRVVVLEKREPEAGSQIP